MLARARGRIPSRASIAAAEVLSPPTTSTSGMRCGGLNGWPMTQRSGCLHFAVMRLISSPDELEAMTTSSGTAASIGREQFDLEVLALRPALLHERRARDRRGDVAVEAEILGAGAGGDQAELFQRRPGRVDETAGEALALRRRIGGGDLVAAGEKDGGPAGADGAGADDAHAFAHGGRTRLSGGNPVWHGRC